MLYEATIRNLTFEEAKMIYALGVSVDFKEIHGYEGQTWSGMAGVSRDPSRDNKTITIQPQKGETQTLRESLQKGDK